MSELKVFIPRPEERELYEKVYKKVERRARRKVLGLFGRPFHGSCHAIWAEMAIIFRDEYGIEWYSPQALNPHVRFD